MEIQTTKNDKKIGDVMNLSPEKIAIIKSTVAKGFTDLELAYFLNVCQSVDMNPFNKEIWSYKDNKGNLLIFAGRDGFLSKAQKNPLFNGIRSCEVREKDEFSIDVANNNIKHTFGISDRGNVVGAYAIVFRKGGEPTIEYALFKTYNKGWGAWLTHKAEMIKKCAETHALKKAFGISGVQSEYDFETKNNIATPINTEIKHEINPEFKDATEKLKICKTKEDIKLLFNNYPILKSNDKFRELFINREKELTENKTD